MLKKVSALMLSLLLCLSLLPCQAFAADSDSNGGEGITLSEAVAETDDHDDGYGVAPCSALPSNREEEGGGGRGGGGGTSPIWPHHPKYPSYP